MGICGSLMDIFDYPQARSAKKQNKKFLFYFAMHSVCTTLLRQVRLHLSTAK